MQRVIITGGRGLIGQDLGVKLQKRGYEVAILGRSKDPDSETPGYTWNIDRGEIDKEAINSCDYIIHLAGANIGKKRWTEKRKKEIVDSRVKSIDLIFKHIDPGNRQLKAFISASASGYYGAVTSEQVFIESNPPAHDFLGKTCKKWEEAADQFTGIGIRTVKLRTGIVLSKKGGALSKLKIPVQWGLGSAIGSGRQYMPWIHLDDLSGMYIHALENQSMSGAYNAVAPEHISNKALTRKIAGRLHKPFWFPNIPACIIKLIFGKMSLMLLRGSRVSPEKIQAAGYTFLFPDLDSAFKDLFSKRP
ncbi:MAG: TIGR01777 family oxidoreductase [Bacteroidales bacterium]|nr:TIGR01777 family oxidoreductase [Bacteroidales bacterium]